MDLAKLISLLSKEALYFACPSEFIDPFEGYFPKSWAKKWQYDIQKRIDDLNETKRNKIAAINLEVNTDVDDKNNRIDAVNKIADDSINKMKISLDEEIKEAISGHGVSCWHKSEYESEAMWKLYSVSGQGIAIESTIGQLKDSIINEGSLKIEDVEYFENESKKELGKINDSLFMKRKAFEHEKELRASILLKEKGKGTLVECNLDKLITCIHVSPFATPYFIEVIEKVCSGEIQRINKSVIPSTLLDKPTMWDS